MRLTRVVWMLAATAPTTLSAQVGQMGYVRLAEREEIALARSAAPEAVSGDATVWTLRDGAYEIAKEGGNGNHCFVFRSLPQSLEPICYDAEAAATIMRWEFEHFRLRAAGYTEEQRELALAEGVGSGDIPMPNRPAMSYMMSSGQRLYDSSSGRSAGNWRPHIMLYVPYLTSEAIGVPAEMASIQVARPGTPMAHLIVVVPDFVDPQTP